MEFFLFIILVGVVIFFVKRNNIRNVNTILSREDIEKLNSTKHACKCYMDGLSLGEQKVADILARELSYKDYFLFNNIILRSANNISTQIDHIVVSRFGIFVIENKNYSGWIFGDEKQSSWTQRFSNGAKFPFQNPLHQNYAHIKALQELIPSIKNCFYSLIVFSGDAEIKTNRIENVIYFDEIIPYIQKSTQEILNENEIQLILGKLSYTCQTINITVAEHISNIHASKNLQN